VTSGLAAVALLLGVGLGYVVWGTRATGVSTNSSALGPGARARSGTTTFPGRRFGTSGGTGTSGSATSGPATSGSGGGSTSSASGSPTDLSSIAARVDPGLVDINTTLSYQSAQAAGTGMVLTATGEVLTNNHVIDGATKISVTDVGNGKTYSAAVVGYDKNQDVAVIQLHGASGLKTVTLGNSSGVQVGEGIVGIGNAGGVGGKPSVAGGSVTAVNQSITASDDLDGTTEHLKGLIEVNADIQPGDSGGSLVNTDGQVVGMDTAGSESQGFVFRTTTGNGTHSFAIPINEAATIAKHIEAGNGSATVHIGKTAFLGVEVSNQQATSTSSRRFRNGFGTFGTSTTTAAGSTASSGSTGTTAAGVTIAGVVTGTPAAEAGLAKGDTITSVGGHAITTPDSLSAVLQGDHPGQQVTVVWTDSSGTSHSATVTLAGGPAD
jgi:S1-C subfamily serine protease